MDAEVVPVSRAAATHISRSSTHVIRTERATSPTADAIAAATRRDVFFVCPPTGRTASISSIPKWNTEKKRDGVVEDSCGDDLLSQERNPADAAYLCETDVSKYV
jgi:hypothetical protein